MFNKFALVITGLMLTVSSVGCCCFGHRYNANYPGGSGGGCAPCNSYAPQGGGYYPPAQQGAFYQGADPSQTAYFGGGMSQTAYAPIQSSYAPTQSAYIPSSTAAMMPGAIQGPPIYNTAVVPTATLPMY